MSEDDDSELVALVASEQRGMRTILIWGFSALFLVVAMSAALGVYYYVVAQTIAADSARLQKRAFETRILADDLANRIAAQEAALRRSYTDMLAIADGSAAGMADTAPIDTARNFLERGIRSLTAEQRLERAIATREAGPDSDLLMGTLALMAWERSGEEITRTSEGLPDRLGEARASFLAARRDESLKPLAQEGLAWIAFERASSPRSNYSAEDCNAVFAETDAIGPAETLGPQPLYWRGQCARKLGRVEQALRNYSLAVRASEAASRRRTGGPAALADEDAILTLRMNALHGLGTVLIAASNDAVGEAMDAALQLARQACNGAQMNEGSSVTAPMYACLEKAMMLRRQLRQTPNQVSGTRENLTFVYLIDDDFDGAFANVTAVEQTGLFAWNELMRAFVSDVVGATGASEDARRNITLFEPSAFNLCEIRKLLKPAHFDAVNAILLEQHPGYSADCS